MHIEEPFEISQPAEEVLARKIRALIQTAYGMGFNAGRKSSIQPDEDQAYYVPEITFRVELL